MQRGEQQGQRKAAPASARQQGPIQHLAAPRRLTIALPAPALGAPRPPPSYSASERQAGGGAPASWPGPARARGGVTPAPGRAETRAGVPPGPAARGPRVPGAPLARGSEAREGWWEPAGRKGRGPGKGAEPASGGGAGGAEAECWWPGARRRGWRCAARPGASGRGRRRNLEVGGPWCSCGGRGATWGGAGGGALAPARPGRCRGGTRVSARSRSQLVGSPEEFA